MNDSFLHFLSKAEHLFKRSYHRLLQKEMTNRKFQEFNLLFNFMNLTIQWRKITKMYISFDYSINLIFERFLLLMFKIQYQNKRIIIGLSYSIK